MGETTRKCPNVKAEIIGRTWERDTITSSKKPRFFIIEEEGRLDFLSCPSSTSNHKLPNIEVQMIKWLPHTAGSLFSCCSQACNHLNKTNHTFSKHN